MTMSECENSCQDGGSSRAMCLLPRAPGPCQDQDPKWYFDNSEKRCMPFYYGGCEGLYRKAWQNFTETQAMVTSLTARRSVSRPVPRNSLERTFASSPRRSVRASTSWSGTTSTSRWALASASSLVAVKVSQGHERGHASFLGNKNNFMTMEDCQGRCSLDYSIPIDEEFKMDFCMEGKDAGRGDKEQQRW